MAPNKKLSHTKKKETLKSGFNHQPDGSSSALQPFNQKITQPSPIGPVVRFMDFPPKQPFPFPSYLEEEIAQAYAATPPIPSTVRVAEDQSPLFAKQTYQTEYEITGYHRSDPTVLWADSIPSPIVPPEERYPASRLLGNGFLSILSFGCPFDDDEASAAAEISFVRPDAPSTLSEELLDHLNEKNERIRLHSEGDAWRAQHAAEIVRHHEECCFARRAAEGEWGLRGWHMSGEYHGQPSRGRARGAASAGRGGRGGGRGGRGGRGRGGVDYGV